MSGSGAPTIEVSGKGKRVFVIATSWHPEIMDGLIQGAKAELERSGCEEVIFQQVPGAFELPLAAQAAAKSLPDAIIALGVVIQGDTPHFDYVCSAATEGLTRVQLDSSIPIGFGLLTVDNEDQALARAGLSGSKEDKGAEAVQAALAMCDIIAGN